MAGRTSGDNRKSTNDKILEFIDKARETAEPVIKDAVAKAGPALENARKSAEPIATNIRSKAQPIIDDAVKKADPYIKKAQKATEPAAKVVKEHSERAVKAAKTVGDDITRKTSKLNERDEVFVQYGNMEVRTTDILDKAREDYVSQGHKLSSIHEIQVYIKPEDGKVYYVVNHTDTGKFNL